MPVVVNAQGRNMGGDTEAPAVTHAVNLLTELFKGLDRPLPLKLWDGTQLHVGRAAPPAWTADLSPFTLVCRSPSVVSSMALARDPLRLAEAYFCDDIDVEGNFFAALGLKGHMQASRPSPLAWVGDTWRMARRVLPGGADLSAKAAPPALPHRVPDDLPNEFYGLWLDEGMVYSCAYFDDNDDDLEQAQRDKMDYICRKLLLQPGERLLDIGCGWGALIMHAARHHGVRAHGITLSESQFTLARARIARAGLQHLVTIELRDYRELPPMPLYDKVVSVGMFEHIGLKNMPAYFQTVSRLLKPGGLFLNHGITHDAEALERTLSSAFIHRYVFPDGQLETIGNVQREMERAAFEVLDVESLRSHYARTLRLWVHRLEARHDEALRHVSEATWRVWRLYMAASALAFESGGIGVYQVLASKRCGGKAAVPLTRRHLYRGSTPPHAEPVSTESGDAPFTRPGPPAADARAVWWP